MMICHSYVDPTRGSLPGTVGTVRIPLAEPRVAASIARAFDQFAHADLQKWISHAWKSRKNRKVLLLVYPDLALELWKCVQEHVEMCLSRSALMKKSESDFVHVCARLLPLQLTGRGYREVKQNRQKLGKARGGSAPSRAPKCFVKAFSLFQSFLVFSCLFYAKNHTNYI